LKVIDKNGRDVPTAQNLISLSIKGSGQIIGVGNGDPNSHELEKANQRSLFNGLAQVIIQAYEDTSTIELLGVSAGLQSFVLKIPVRKAKATPSLAVLYTTIELNDWRMSALSDTKPNPMQEIAENDMNSWAPTKSMQLQTFADGRYALFRTNFTLTDFPVKTITNLQFKDITGKAEIWLDNKLIFSKATKERATVNVPFEGYNKNYQLQVLIEADRNEQAGLGGVVSIVTTN
jgi:beta-galactosidase